VLETLLCLFTATGAVDAARIKDLAMLEGARENSLVGYGLVVGLAGTGDGNQAVFTPQSIANMLRRLGMDVPAGRVRVKNAAAVMVTARVPPFSRPGRLLDVTVSSVGDATSLQGGTLLLTPLLGPDGAVYGGAQGPVSIGGAHAASSGGSRVQKNHPTAGRVPGGAMLEREIAFDLAARREHRLLLTDPDFTTAARIEGAVNAAFGDGTARAIDAGGVAIAVPLESSSQPVAFLSRLEDLEVEPAVRARLVFNEKTGTVVMGADLRISQVAIAHGSMSVNIETDVEVSQPAPWGHGDTVVTEQPFVEAREEPASVLVLERGATIGDLVNGLNEIGATARDMMAIFQAIRAAGALQAEIVIQ
jgi:flagellar P-ring protein precursor FlgI